MPLQHVPVVNWPTELDHLLAGAQIATGSEGKRYCLIDADVDARTLLAIHNFEARVRRRHRVQLRLAGSAECMIGEMNPSFGLGAPSDPTRHITKVRISFHDLQAGDCVDEADRY